MQGWKHFNQNNLRAIKGGWLRLCLTEASELHVSIAKEPGAQAKSAAVQVPWQVNEFLYNSVDVGTQNWAISLHPDTFARLHQCFSVHC